MSPARSPVRFATAGLVAEVELSFVLPDDIPPEMIKGDSHPQLVRDPFMAGWFGVDPAVIASPLAHMPFDQARK